MTERQKQRADDRWWTAIRKAVEHFDHKPDVHRNRSAYIFDDLNSREKAILRDLAGECTVCGSTDRLHLDHDHDSGIVRGVLCQNCNFALGRLGDSIERLIALACYLRRHDRWVNQQREDPVGYFAALDDFNA